jgi:hypothetical protein
MNETDSKVESLFIKLESIFDNYDGYERRLKAYEIINDALYASDSVCYKECGNTKQSGGIDNICLNCGSSFKKTENI